MRRAFLLTAVITVPLTAQQQPPQQPSGQPQQQQQQRRAPRPYAQVITDKAITDAGGITSHRVD
ncbi:MAG: hypothetical protein ACREOG_09500, partial [Gemmatimonadaceae bacterium]